MIVVLAQVKLFLSVKCQNYPLSKALNEEY